METGYLPDQFLQDVSNKRTDEYGGSIENRTRFVREILQSITGAIGEKRTAIRISPWSTFLGTSIQSHHPEKPAIKMSLVHE